MAPQALAAPKAELVASSWQLDLEFSDPQRISIVLPGDSHATTFWYLLYEVTNNTRRDVEFYPSFRLVTDTLTIVEGGAEVSPSVYTAISGRHGKEYPFFAPPHKVTGTLRQGEENARASAAVFREFDPQASKFTVFVAGLSGELAKIANPSAADAKARSGDVPRSYVLRRTLAISYDLPGDPKTRNLAKPIRRNREWVMR